jgi:hypothetical protein
LHSRVNKSANSSCQASNAERTVRCALVCRAATSQAILPTAAGAGLIDDLHEGVELPLELRERVQPAEQACQSLLQFCAAVADRRLDQRVAVGEVVVKLSLSHARCG